MSELAPIRPATPVDAHAIAAIYDPYVRETVITFEEEPVSADAFRVRIADTATLGLPWLVAESGEGVVGYAYAGPWKARRSYRHTVEVSVYLAQHATGRGLGRALYTALLAALQERGAHVAIGGIALPNAASVALHERLGFTKVAHFPEVGWKFGRWIDVGYWQRTLEPPGRENG